MNDTESRIADLIVAKLRERDPSSGPGDLHRPLADLDFDSLDLIELHQQLEFALQVKGNTRETENFTVPADFIGYFAKLMSPV